MSSRLFSKVPCCPSCEVPWVIEDQQEYAENKLLEGLRVDDPDAHDKVKDYWKDHVLTWIDDLPHDTTEELPSSLWEVYQHMCERQVMLCEDCNDSTDGSRCWRNMSREDREIVKIHNKKRGRPDDDDEPCLITERPVAFKKRAEREKAASEAVIQHLDAKARAFKTVKATYVEKVAQAERDIQRAEAVIEAGWEG